MRQAQDAKRFLNQKLLFLGLGAIIGIYCCGAGQTQKQTVGSVSQAEHAGKKPPIPVDPMLLLPKECFGAVYVDMQVLRQSPLIAGQVRKADRNLNDPQKYAADYLFDHSGSAALCLARMGSNKRGDPDAALVLRGDFDPTRLETLAKDLVANDKVPGFKPAAESAGPGPDGYKQLARSSQAQALALDDRTLLIASHALVPKVLDAAAGKDSSRFVDSPLYRRLNPYVGFGQCALCAVMAMPPKVKERMAQKTPSGSFLSKYVEIINGIDAAALRIDLKSAIDVDLVVETASAEHPPLLADAIKGAIALGKLVFDDATFRAAADQVKVTADGLVLRAQLHATEKQAAHIFSLLEQKAAEAPKAPIPEK